jgi:prevent-host-death family protein
MVTFQGLLMQTIKASEFKAKCLASMDQVARTGETILVTKNGKPVAELRPHRGARVLSPFGIHKGLVELSGDIVSPLDVDWEAMLSTEAGISAD